MEDKENSNQDSEMTEEAKNMTLLADKSNQDELKKCSNIDTVAENLKELEFSFKLLSQAKLEFANNRENYLKGCKWAPDGTCILTNSNDAILRVFDLNNDMINQEGQEIKDLKPSLKIQEPEIIYDYTWYPFMDSSNPDTACIFSTSKNNPIHLIDAYTGQVRCSYKGYNHVDELVNAFSIAFNSDASKLYGGYKKSIKIFDISLPGRNYQEVKLNDDNFKITGLISCIAFSKQQSGVYAVGSYSKQVGIYVETSNTPVCQMESHSGGVTHLMFSADGTKLFSGSRKDPDIFCWDIRNPGKLLQVFKRDVKTNQRIYFDLLYDDINNTDGGDCKYLTSGNHNGAVSLWKATDFDLSVESEPLLTSFTAHQDCVNGVSFHPYQNVLATSSGQRRIFPKSTANGTSNSSSSSSDSSSSDEDDDNDGEKKVIIYENTLKIWTHNLRKQ